MKHKKNKLETGDRAIAYKKTSPDGKTQIFISYLSNEQWLCKGAFFNPSSYPVQCHELADTCANKMAVIYYNIKKLHEWHKKDKRRIRKALKLDTLKVFPRDKEAATLVFSSPEINTYLEGLFSSYLALLDVFTKLSVFLISNGIEKRFNQGFRKGKVLIEGREINIAGGNYAKWLENQIKEYDVDLIFRLKNNANSLKKHVIYLDENGNYLLSNRLGELMKGILNPAELDLSNLENKVENSEFKKLVLESASIKPLIQINHKEKIKRLISLLYELAAFFTYISDIRNNFIHYNHVSDFSPMFAVIHEGAKSHKDIKNIFHWKPKSENCLLDLALSMDEKIRYYLKESLLVMPHVRIEKYLVLDKVILDELV